MRKSTMPAVAARAFCVLVCTAGFAWAQAAAPSSNDAHPGQAGAGMDGKVIGAGSGSAEGAPGSNVVDSAQGGVGGTGLGKMPPVAAAPGTGMSVKGPAGQGISNSTDKMQ